MNDFINNLPLETILQVIIASPILSAVMAGIIKLVRAQKDIVKLSLVFLGACTVAGVNYVMNATSEAHPSIIAMQGMILAFTAQPFYYLLIKPLFRWVGVKLANAAAWEEEVRSAAAPVAPAEAPPVVEPNFSN